LLTLAETLENSRGAEDGNRVADLYVVAATSMSELEGRRDPPLWQYLKAQALKLEGKRTTRGCSLRSGLPLHIGHSSFLIAATLENSWSE
jgi:hypothetical protein